jgi:hypothetical protein
MEETLSLTRISGNARNWHGARHSLLPTRPHLRGFGYDAYQLRTAVRIQINPEGPGESA